MNTAARLKLDMATRVRDFLVSHPYANASYSTVLARLEDRIARGETLAAQQRAGAIAVAASTARRADLRRLLRQQPLRHLLRIAQAASKEQPELAKRFRLPANRANHQVFRTAARAIAEEAKASRELFVRYGLSETILDDLSATLDEYDQAVSEAHAGKLAHLGARADLEAVVREIMDLVHQLDGMNLYRLRNDTEVRAAWESARNIAWPNGGPAAGSIGSASGPGTVAPAA